MALEFLVRNQRLKLFSGGPVVADSQQYLKARFTFSEDWQGTRKYAQFRRDGEVYTCAIDEYGETEVPWETLVGKGVVQISAFATNQQNEENKLITTNPVFVKVETSGIKETELPKTPSLGILGSHVDESLKEITDTSNQLILQMTEIRDRVLQAEEHIDQTDYKIYVGESEPTEEETNAVVWINPAEDDGGSDELAEAVASAQNAATLAQAWAEDSTELPSGKHSAKEWADIAEQGIMPNGVVTENKLGSDVKQRFANIENSIKDYCGIDTFEGSTDTEKLQKAIDTSQGVVLTRDITIDNIQFTKHNFYIFGAGHTVHINGTISSTILYGKGYYFDGCVFDGTGGGQFSFDGNFLVTRFTNCCFYNFTNDICTGSNMQSIYFTNCYFNDNHSWAVNATRLDAVIFASCNVENGNTNFMKCNIGYNVVIRDTIIEGLSGIAFDLKGIGDCIFEGLYLEGNHENFVIQQDACGNVKFDSVHCNFLDEDNKVLVRLTEGGTAGMYGVFTFLNCSTDNQGYFVRVNSDGWFSKRLSFINNRGVAKNIIWDNAIRNGNISSGSLMYDSREISGVFANDGSNLMLDTIETECYGHKIVGCIVMKVLNESRSNIVKDTTLYKAIVYDDEVLILFGDGTNTYHYTVTFLYC